MCMSCRYFEINDKTQFSCIFGHFFGREYEKTHIVKQLFLLRYLVSIILNSTVFMVSEWWMDPRYSTKKA